MNILGYLVTMVNLQNMANVDNPLKEAKLHLAPLEDLTYKLKNMPDFPLEVYKTNGFQRHGNVAFYASKSLRDFMFAGLGDPQEEGVLLELCYCNKGECSIKYDTVSYFIHGKEADPKLLEKVSKQMTDIAVRGSTRRSKRSLLYTLKPLLNVVDT